MINKIDLQQNNFESQEDIDSLKKLRNLFVWAVFCALQAQAGTNQDLEKSFKTNSFSSNKTIEKKSDENSSIDLPSSNYSDFINVYWVGQKVWGNSYNWAWIKIHDEHIEVVWEKWKDYTKLWAIWKIDFWDTWAYTKLWASYLKFDNYKVGQYTIDPRQTTYAWALWYGNESLNVEWGYMYHDLTWAKWADSISNTKYLELIARTKTQVWQFDLSGTIKNQEAYNKSKTYFDASGAYYPTEDIQLKTTYDNSRPYIKDDYKIKAWIKYTFWWDEEWSFSPFIWAEYATADNIKVEASYEDSIANRPLSWKDEFESNVFTNNIVAQKVAPKEFRKKVIDSFNQAPSISISSSASTVNEWTAFTLTANASDPDGTISSIKWYDANGNQVWSGTSVSITENTAWTYSFYAIATDNLWATKQSSNVSVTVNQVNQAPSISISSSASTVNEWTAFTLTANASDPDGTISSIKWYDANGNQVWSGTSVSITENTAWTYSFYAIATDNLWATKQSSNVSITVNSVNTSWPSITAPSSVTAATSVDVTIWGLQASDPDWIGSYTITSALFWTLVSWNWNLPSSVTITSSQNAWHYGDTDTITINVTDAHSSNPKTSTKTITVNYYN